MKNSLIEFYAEEMAELEKDAKQEANLEERDLADEGDHSTGRYEAIIQVEKLIKEKLDMNHQKIIDFYENCEREE